MKKNIEITLDKAIEWYRKGGDLRELTLTAFPKKDLDVNEFEWDYNMILEEFEKKYPIGTVVWSNDGTDHFPNVIISKPYLKDIKSCWSMYNIKKYIVFDTKRILMDEVWSSRIEIRDKEEFEQIKIKSYSHPDGFDYIKWKKQFINEHNTMINRMKEIIDDNEKEIIELKEKISKYEVEIRDFDIIYNNCLDKIKT